MDNDLISRSAVLAIGNVRRVTEHDEAGYDVSYDAVPVEVIEALPAIDAVPVVRCWGCKYRRSLVCPMRHDRDYGQRDYTEDDGFCYLGEKSEEDTDGSQTD